MGNALLVGEGPPDDRRGLFVGLYYRGQRRTDLEREYLEVYQSIDEAIPRVRQLPDSHLVLIKDLYMAEELKTSRTYNEAFRRSQHQHVLNVRLDGLGGSGITWSLADPVASEGWGSSQIAMVRRLMPHVRQFIRVRQALVRAQAGDTTVTALLETPRIGVLHLDRRGRILAVNDRARRLLRRRAGVSDAAGVLQAPRAGRPGPSGAAGGRGAPDLQRGAGQWIDAAGPRGRGAPVGGARYTRGGPAAGLRRAARRGAGLR